MFALLSYRDGTPIVLAGPCWPFCTFVTVPLILSISFVVCYFLIVSDRFGVVRDWNIFCSVFLVVSFTLVLIDHEIPFPPQPDWMLVFYVPAVIFVLISLFCVSCRDPGLMERVTVRTNILKEFARNYYCISSDHWNHRLGWRSWGRWLVLEWTSRKLSTTRCSVLPRMWCAYTGLWSSVSVCWRFYCSLLSFFIVRCCHFSTWSHKPNSFSVVLGPELV
jgi:hypothetical protein